MFSPDSQHVAYLAEHYLAEHNKKQIAVVDGVDGKEFDEISGIEFSPDSRHMAYAAKQGERTRVVIDGEESRDYYRLALQRYKLGQ